MTKTSTLVAGTALGLAMMIGASVAVTEVRAQEPQDPGGFAGRLGRPGGPGGRGMRGPGGPGGPGGVIQGLRGLDLADAQREQVKATMDAHKAEVEAQFSRSRAARKTLHGAVTAGTFDESAVRQASADLATVEADGAVLRAKVHAEVWALLTPEQQQKAQALQAQMEQRRSQMRERFEQRRGQRQERRQQRQPLRG